MKRISVILSISIIAAVTLIAVPHIQLIADLLEPGESSGWASYDVEYPIQTYDLEIILHPKVVTDLGQEGGSANRNNRYVYLTVVDDDNNVIISESLYAFNVQEYTYLINVPISMGDDYHKVNVDVPSDYTRDACDVEVYYTLQ